MITMIITKSLESQILNNRKGFFFEKLDFIMYLYIFFLSKNF